MGHANCGRLLVACWTSPEVCGLQPSCQWQCKTGLPSIRAITVSLNTSIRRIGPSLFTEHKHKAHPPAEPSTTTQFTCLPPAARQHACSTQAHPGPWQLGLRRWGLLELLRDPSSSACTLRKQCIARAAGCGGFVACSCMSGRTPYYCRRSGFFPC